MDKVIGSGLRYLYFNQISGFSYRTTHSIIKSKEEILIFGDSRANHHYIPEILTEETDLSCYNTGRDGESIFYHSALQGVILERYTPKIIVLDINPSLLVKSKTSYDKLSSLLPYYKNYEGIRWAVELRAKFEKIKLFSSIYPFNSNLLSSIKYSIVKEKDYNGYIPLFEVMDEPKSEVNSLKHKSSSNNRPELDINKVKALETFFLKSKERGVHLFLVISPLYGVSQIDPELINTIQNNINQYKTDKFKVSFFDYSRDERFIRNPSLFRDNTHMNHNGATLFSEIVAKKIKSELERPTR